MKYLFPLAAAALTIALQACEPMPNNTANIKRLQDTLFTLYPTVNRVTVEVRNETELIVTLGDKELYNAPAKHDQTAAEISSLSKFIFQSNEHIRKGSLTIVPQEQGLTAAGEGKTYPLQLTPAAQ